MSFVPQASGRNRPMAVFVRRVGFSRKPTFRAVLRRRERAYAGHWRCLYRFVKADTRKGPFKDYATFGPKRACHHWGLEIHRSQNRVIWRRAERPLTTCSIYVCTMQETVCAAWLRDTDAAGTQGAAVA